MGELRRARFCESSRGMAATIVVPVPQDRFEEMQPAWRALETPSAAGGPVKLHVMLSAS
jgi:hypothetical protein